MVSSSCYVSAEADGECSLSTEAVGVGSDQMYGQCRQDSTAAPTNCKIAAVICCAERSETVIDGQARAGSQTLEQPHQAGRAACRSSLKHSLMGLRLAQVSACSCCFAAADQDSVRLLAVESCGAFAAALSKEDCASSLLPVVQKFAQVWLVGLLQARSAPANGRRHQVAEVNFIDSWCSECDGTCWITPLFSRSTLLLLCAAGQVVACAVQRCRADGAPVRGAGPRDDAR